MDLETYELIKAASRPPEDGEERMEKEAAWPLLAGVALLGGGGMAVYQGRQQAEQQQQQNAQIEQQQNEQRLPGQGRADPQPSNYPGQELTGNPAWDLLSEAYQEYLANREGQQYGPDNYGPQFYTRRDYLDPSWGPARDPSLPAKSGVPYEKAHLGYVIPHNRGLWAWDPTTPGGLRNTMEMNYAMSQYGPRSGQENFNVAWQEAKGQEAGNLTAGKNKFQHIEDAEKSYKEKTTPFPTRP